MSVRHEAVNLCGKKIASDRGRTRHVSIYVRQPGPYTHLKLPTNLRVQTQSDAVASEKKDNTTSK